MNQQKVVYILFLLFFSYQIQAQQEWIYGDSLSTLPGLSIAFDIQNTPSGGFVLFGETDFPTGAIRHNTRLLHTDSEGQIILDTTYFEGDVVSEFAQSVYPTTEGDFLLLTGSSLVNAELRKVDLAGHILWAVEFPPFQQFTDVRIDNAGDIFLAGVLVIDTPYSLNPSITKLEGDTGTHIWTKTHALHPISSINCLEMMPDGGGIAGGTNGSAGLLLRFDNQGDTLWTKNIYNSKGDVIRDVAVYEDGSILFCGDGSGFAGLSPEAGKVNAQGDIEWLTYASSTLGTATGIVHLSDGSIRVTGSIYSNIFFDYTQPGFLSELSTDGTLISSEIWGEGKNGSSIVRTGNCFAIAGIDQYSFLLRKECLGTNATEKIEIEEGFFAISPNPNSGVFSLHFLKENKTEKRIQVFDYQGKKIETLWTSTTSSEIDLSPLPSGIYFISIQEKGVLLSTQKIIIQK